MFDVLVLISGLTDWRCRIVTDPYVFRIFELQYGRINEKADLVTISHNHEDHNDYYHIKGKPVILTKPETGMIKDILINGIQTYHDATRGSQRGANIIFTFRVDDVNICHLGDLGYILSVEEIAELGNVDILLIPIGGKFTFGPVEANQLVEKIKPAVVIPMHYKNSKCLFLTYGVDDFITGKKSVRKPEDIEVEFNRGSLPSSTEIFVMKSAL
ncbi:MAG: MBL fold metallo-hydrolase [Chloroflexi bacterium]|nr:MBL fold metallo-hydrolase [Chloroflexota bacterium]